MMDFYQLALNPSALAFSGTVDHRLQLCRHLGDKGASATTRMVLDSIRTLDHLDVLPHAVGWQQFYLHVRSSIILLSGMCLQRHIIIPV